VVEYSRSVGSVFIGTVGPSVNNLFNGGLTYGKILIKENGSYNMNKWQKKNETKCEKLRCFSGKIAHFAKRIVLGVFKNTTLRSGASGSDQVGIPR
jgi:hypothetical protein